MSEAHVQHGGFTKCFLLVLRFISVMAHELERDIHFKTGGGAEMSCLLIRRLINPYAD